MKLFVSKTKDWARKAEQLKAALETVPPTVSEIRESVAHTTDQLRLLRAEVRSSVTELKADNDVQLSEAMQEIKAGMAVFLEAGYELSGLDIEISPSQRMVLRLISKPAGCGAIGSPSIDFPDSDTLVAVTGSGMVMVMSERRCRQQRDTRLSRVLTHARFRASRRGREAAQRPPEDRACR